MGVVLSMAVLGSPALLYAEVEEPNADIDSMAPDFVLKDANGQQHSWTQYKRKEGLVVLFMAVEAVEHAAAVRQAARWLGEAGFGVVLVDVSYKTSPNEARKIYRAHSLDIPDLYDPERLIGPLYGVDRVPRLFVLDSEMFVRYKSGLANKASMQALKVGVGQMLSGQSITAAQGDLAGVPVRLLRHQLGK